MMEWWPFRSLFPGSRTTTSPPRRLPRRPTGSLSGITPLRYAVCALSFTRLRDFRVKLEFVFNAFWNAVKTRSVLFFKHCSRQNSTVFICLQPFDEGGRRIATPSVLTSTIGMRLFSSLDDGTGYTPVEYILDAWIEDGIENSTEILQVHDWS